MPEEFHNNSWVATRSIEFLRRRDKTRPFFLFMSFHRPHPPIDPPQAFYDMYEDRDVPEVPVGDWADVHDVTIDHLDAWHGRLPKETLARSRRAYYAQVAHIDNQVGRIIQAMRVLKTGPTAIIFTADHGEMLGDHHLFRKSYAYEGSAAVPLVVSMPGRTGRGHCDAPVISHDVYPTILDVAGVDVPGKIDGRSFLHFADNPSSTDRRDYVHGEHSACYDEDNAMQYLTNGREKFIWFTTTGQEQFFDLVNDPHEKHDLARDPSAKDRIEKWRQRLIDELAPRTQDDLTDGKRLISGVRLPAVRPVLSGDSRQRQEDASEKV